MHSHTCNSTTSRYCNNNIFLITFNNAHAQLTVLNTSLAVSKQKQATAEHSGVEKQKTSTSAFSYITLFLYFTNGFEYSSCLCLLCPLGRHFVSLVVLQTRTWGTLSAVNKETQREDIQRWWRSLCHRSRLADKQWYSTLLLPIN